MVHRVAVLAVLGVIGVVAITYLATQEVRRVESEFVKLREESFPVREVVHRLQTTGMLIAIEAHVIGLEEGTGPERLAHAKAEMAAARADLQAHLEEYRRLVRTFFPDETELLQGVEAAAFPLDARVARLLSLHEAGAPHAEVAAAAREAELQMGAFLEASKAVEEHEVKELAERSSVMKESLETARRNMVAFAVVTSPMIVLLCAMLIAGIRRPVAELRGAFDAIGRGDLSPRLKPGGDDEFRGLAQNVLDMGRKLRAHEEELRGIAATDARNERLLALGSLSAGVAHEINNPLAFMRASMELSLKSAARAVEAPRTSPEGRRFAEEVQEDLKVNLDGIDRIAHIVRSLSVLAKPEAGRGAICIAPVLDATRALVSTRLGKGVELQCAVEPGLVVDANPSGLGQVVLNLLLNAADAVPPRDGFVRLVAQRVGDRVRIEVEDNGPGIPEAIRPRIFTPFFTTKPKGTGLGLSVSQRIVEEHQGRLWFEDRPGGGTRFIAEFPAPHGEPGDRAVSGGSPALRVPQQAMAEAPVSRSGQPG